MAPEDCDPAMSRSLPGHLPPVVGNTELPPMSCPGHDTTVGHFHIKIDVYSSSAASQKCVDEQKEQVQPWTLTGSSCEGP